jgi:hypothetical protein
LFNGRKYEGQFEQLQEDETVEQAQTVDRKVNAISFPEPQTWYYRNLASEEESFLMDTFGLLRA